MINMVILVLLFPAGLEVLVLMLFVFVVCSSRACGEANVRAWSNGL